MGTTARATVIVVVVTALAVAVVVMRDMMLTLVGLPVKLPQVLPKRQRASRAQEEKGQEKHKKEKEEAVWWLPEDIRRGARERKAPPLAFHRPPRISLTPLAPQAPQGPLRKGYREQQALRVALEAEKARSWGGCAGHGRSRRPHYLRGRGFFLRRSRRGKGYQNGRVPRLSR